MKLEFSRQFFEKYSNTKFDENLSSESRVVTCGQTDMTRLTVALRNFVNVPNKTQLSLLQPIIGFLKSILLSCPEGDRDVNPLEPQNILPTHCTNYISAVSWR